MGTGVKGNACCMPVWWAPSGSSPISVTGGPIDIRGTTPYAQASPDRLPPSTCSQGLCSIQVGPLQPSPLSLARPRTLPPQSGPSPAKGHPTPAPGLLGAKWRLPDPSRLCGSPLLYISSVSPRFSFTPHVAPSGFGAGGAGGGNGPPHAVLVPLSTSLCAHSSLCCLRPNPSS